MSTYRQLSIEQRCSIARLREGGQSIRQIAAARDRQPSTIARELKLNSGAKVGYQPAYAQAQIDAPRWTGARSRVTIAYNNTTRKCLAIETPAETVLPLHFKCESTPGSSPG
jgi:hypothetical protein